MKAQSSGWNVIVIAAIGLVVLFILIFLATNGVGIFSRGASSCEDKGGVCSRECSFDNGFSYAPLECPDEIPKCCLPQTNTLNQNSERVVVREG